MSGNDEWNELNEDFPTYFELAFFGAVLVAKWAAYGNGANFRPCLRQAGRPECPLNSLGGMRAREEGRGGAKPLADAARGPVARWRDGGSGGRSRGWLVGWGVDRK